MNKYPILTVVYFETEAHYKMALKSWAAYPADSEIVAVVNRGLVDHAYPDSVTVIENDENCLARAWNIGLKYFFDKGYSYVFVSGLDSLAPSEAGMQKMIAALNDTTGLVSADPGTDGGEPVPVQHGDGSFSFYLISREAFEETGKFNEDFKPAYFEDNNYLERLWKAGYKPMMCRQAMYYHIFQGTVKHGPEIATQYPEFMQRNLELFVKIHGFVPPHLPSDIRFN